jgi:hypothetical protein
MSKIPVSSINAPEIALDEIITKTVSTDITGYTIDQAASLIFDKSLTITVLIYSYNKVIERKRLTLIKEDFNNWMKDGRDYLDIFVKNNIFNNEKK